MLNYIWAGLIILSFAFALLHDFGDIRKDTYRNGKPVPIAVSFSDSFDPDARRQEVTVTVDASAAASHFGNPVELPPSMEGVLIRTEDGQQLRFARDISLPEPLATVRTMTSRRDNDLRGLVSIAGVDSTGNANTSVLFGTVRFVKLTAISKAAIDFAETAVSLALGLIGALALWMGLLQIGQAAGLIDTLTRFTQPVIRRFFPEIPENHPAMGMIVLNLTANMLGLGNAATPLGIKAMDELQTLNPTEDTATNSMVTLLALNTASVQIVPPVLLVAIMGLQINQIFFSIVIVTLLSAIIALFTSRFFSRMKKYRANDPNRIVEEAG